ncbi:hypothetical protein RRG08_030180 [Elysia crispata]|uniref:Uncharacterized protein n=1 Tax=Elysia crispata TaxID=231223 RepID=A0AAE0ZR73_9GAST|nr:hypothetical protein RRG08_030180 [Elysia crispata]
MAGLMAGRYRVDAGSQLLDTVLGKLVRAMKSRAERGVSDRVYARLITLNRWVIYCMFSTIEPWLLLVRVLMYTEAYVHVPQPVQAGGESPDHQDHE